MPRIPLLDKALRVLDRAEEALISVLMAAATLVIFAAVVHRYASGIQYLSPLARSIHMSWAQELCIYMFVWMAKFGAAYGVRTGIHVGVDVLVDRVRPEARKVMIVFGLLCGALFTAIVGTMGAKFVWDLAATDQTTPDLELPSWIAYACIPAGSYLMCFRFLQVAIRYLMTGELPHHRAAEIEALEPNNADVGPT